MASNARTPFPTDPGDFDADPRISWSKPADTYVLEDEAGDEWEWLAKPGKWVPVADEALVEQQRQAYRIEGVDDEAPAVDHKKRKAADGGEEDHTTNGKAAKKQKAEEQQQQQAPLRKERRNTAVYITSLPADVTQDELHHVFSRFGVIAESPDTNAPRVKLYHDSEGDFQGDALIVYFRPESVQLAIDMLDETDFRLGQPVATGPMRVKEADASYKSQKGQPLSSEQAKKKGTSENRDRQKVIKKTQEMNSRLAEWSDEDDNPSTLPDTSSRWDKVVVLKHMFTLAELADDPRALLDIKEDIRDECEKFGKVTNVVLYDQEEHGVVTVRFGDATAAEACVKVFDGRWFDKRQVKAYVADGRERFKKSRKKDAEDGGEEAERLERFGEAIEGEEA